MMKAITKTFTTVGIWAFCLLVSANAFAVVVTLDVDDSTDPPRLYVSNNNAQCPGGPVDCIEVAQGSQPNMFFKLNRACQPGGAEYGLSGFYITEDPKVWPATLSSSIASDFCADPGTGEVNLSSCGNNQNDGQLKIKNFNRQEVTVYYMVTAEHCSSGEEITLDPEIRNRGGSN